MIKLIVNFKKGKPFYVQLYDYIRKAVEQGRIQAHERIPSVRQAAAELELSRTTVENAYGQLLLEGYIYSRKKSGYYASDIGEILPLSDREDDRCTNGTYPPSAISEEYIEEDRMFLDTWRKCYTRILTCPSKNLFYRAVPQGEPELREQISSYVYRARGVKCNAGRIVIGAGVQVLLGILSVILRQKGIVNVAFEKPGFTDVTHVFKDRGFNLIPVRVDNTGLDLKTLRGSSAGICYVSPTHQYPTGMIMPVKKRLSLLRWAKKNNSFIIEDDYDSELRYSGRPVPSLQSLDTAGRVVYMGSFSTVLLPSLRISYMALPEELFGIYKRTMNKFNQTVSKTEQLTLAMYIREGEFERHLRRIRKKYAAKHEIFRHVLADTLGDDIRAGGSESGTGIPVHTGILDDIESVTDQMKMAGLPVRHVGDDLLVFGFCFIPECKMKDAISAFTSIINSSIRACQ